jgi:hypothetical protein
VNLTDDEKRHTSTEMNRYTKDRSMTNPEDGIYIAIVPEGTVTITPSTPTPEHLYQYVQGRDLIGVRFDDRRVGSVFLALTPVQAQHISVTLQHMLGQLDELRRESEERNNPR